VAERGGRDEKTMEGWEKERRRREGRRDVRGGGEKMEQGS